MTEPAPHRAAIVIGGGPAGSLTALLLARARWRVDLLEQHRFPRDKVCGECLSALGLAVLDRAGLTARLAAHGPVRLERTLIHPADGPMLDVPLPRFMWGLTRHTLDQVLLDAAAEAGVIVHQPARCEHLEPDPARPSVTWRDLRTNRSTTTQADWIVIADGKGAFPGPVPRATGDLGIKTHFTGVNGPRDAIELFAGPGCYGGLAAVEGDRWNAAFALPATAVRQTGGNVAAAFEQVVAHNPALAFRLGGATRVGAWLATPLPRFAVRHQWPARCVPVGNAAAALEPIGGEGMGLALGSAEMAVQQLLEIAAAQPNTTGPCADSDGTPPARRGRVGDADCPALRKATPATWTVADLDTQAIRRDANTKLATSFQKLWFMRRVACRTLARAISNPNLSISVAPLMEQQPGLTRTALAWAGKSSAGLPLQ